MRILLAALLAATALAGCAGDEADDAPRLSPVGPVARPSQLGTVPYDGPTTPEGLKSLCQGGGYGNLGCYVETLQAYLHAEGSVKAFALLDDLGTVDPAANTQAHAISHELGRYALAVYGGIELTLAECSYEVFQGCLHGALQAYFDSLPEVEPAYYRDVCPTEPPFHEYACLHGMGHGFQLYTRYDMNGSLEMCDALRTDFARSSCWGGVFMENMVAFMDRENPVAGLEHAHGDTSNITFMINREDPLYPCNAVASKYQQTCWLLQTSLILFFNGGDFQKGAQACDAAPEEHVLTCFRSLGRDASAYANSECGARATQCYVTGIATRCSHGAEQGRGLCVAGAVAEVILNFASPEPGLQMCQLSEAIDKPFCYEEMGVQAANMLQRPELENLCGRSESAYQDECRRGARI